MTLAITVTPSTATGLVLLYDGTTQIAQLSLTGGSAVYTTSSLTAGSHAITAYYGSDQFNNESTSPVITQTVRVATTTTLTSSRNPANRSQTVTFTARVTSSSATGQVQFHDGATLLATHTLSNGVATYSVQNWTSGTHPVQVLYLGNTTYANSNSPVLNQVIR